MSKSESKSNAYWTHHWYGDVPTKYNLFTHPEKEEKGKNEDTILYDRKGCPYTIINGKPISRITNYSNELTNAEKEYLYAKNDFDRAINNKTDNKEDTLNKIVNNFKDKLERLKELKEDNEKNNPCYKHSLEIDGGKTKKKKTKRRKRKIKKTRKNRNK